MIKILICWYKKDNRINHVAKIERSRSSWFQNMTVVFYRIWWAFDLVINPLASIACRGNSLQQWRMTRLNQINLETFSNWNKTDETSRRADHSPPAGDPNINFVKIDFLQDSRRLWCPNENKDNPKPCVCSRMSWENTIDRISHMSNKWWGPQQLVSILIFICRTFKQTLPLLP